MINLKDFFNTDLIPFLESIRGMGKTQYVQDYAKKEGMEFYCLNLSSIESSDFCGLPYIENETTKYAKPSFLNIKNAILFLDEANRVTDIDVKSALNSLLLDRVINGHVFDSSNLIVMAGNPVNEDYETSDFDISLEDRVIKLPFYYSYNDFVIHLKNKGETPFTNFVENNEDIFTDVSRRRIYETNKMLLNTKNEKYIASFLGKNVFNLYNAYNSKRLFSLENVLNGETTKDVVKYLLNDFDSKNSTNINKFLTNIPAESKLIFFKTLKESEVSEKQVDSFLEAGVFTKLGKYIKELF